MGTVNGMTAFFDVPENASSRRRTRFLFAALTIFVFAAAACSGGDSTDTDAAADTEPDNIVDGRYIPDETTNDVAPSTTEPENPFEGAYVITPEQADAATLAADVARRANLTASNDARATTIEDIDVAISETRREEAVTYTPSAGGSFAMVTVTVDDIVDTACIGIHSSGTAGFVDCPVTTPAPTVTYPTADGSETESGTAGQLDAVVIAEFLAGDANAAAADDRQPVSFAYIDRALAAAPPTVAFESGPAESDGAYLEIVTTSGEETSRACVGILPETGKAGVVDC